MLDLQKIIIDHVLSDDKFSEKKHRHCRYAIASILMIFFVQQHTYELTEVWIVTQSDFFSY